MVGDALRKCFTATRSRYALHRLSTSRLCYRSRANSTAFDRLVLLLARWLSRKGVIVDLWAMGCSVGLRLPVTCWWRAADFQTSRAALQVVASLRSATTSANYRGGYSPSRVATLLLLTAFRSQCVLFGGYLPSVTIQCFKVCF